MSFDDLKFRTSVQDEGSSDIKFELSEKFKRNVQTEHGDVEKDFTKMTARFQYGTRYGDKTFFSTYWKPGEDQTINQDSIKALVFICHGYAEYLGDGYDDIAKDCLSKVEGGCLVFGHDHVGHGRTTAGDRAYVNDMYDYVNPVFAHIKAVQQWPQFNGKQLPVFLIGHSMGGLISIFTLLREQSLFSGFIGIGPAVKIHRSKATPFKRWFAQLTQRYIPRFSLPGWIDGIKLHEVTRNQVWVQHAKGDKLRYHGGTKVRMGWILFDSSEKAKELFSQITLPILVLQGGKDKLADPEGSRMLVDKSSSNDKDYQEYRNAFHALMVEIDDDSIDKVKVKSDVQEKIVEFINEKLNNSPDLENS